MEIESNRPVVVVVAGGAGARFEGAGHKLLQDFCGRSVLGTTLSAVMGAHLPLVVVTTDELAAEAARWVAARDIVLVEPAGQPGTGMGRSIARGISARAQAPGWLVLPADMPAVTPASILAVARALQQAPVAYAQHRGRRGHPVGFAAELYSELRLLDGDVGARRIIARYPHEAVEVDDAGVLVDVDTLEDLHAARRLRQALTRGESVPGPHDRVL